MGSHFDKIVAATAGLFALSAGTCAWAAEWSFEPHAEYRADYSDNILLAIDDEIDALGHRLDLSAHLTARTPLSTIRLTPRARFTRYPGEQDLDRDDQFLHLQASRILERGAVDLQASYDRDSTISSELDASGFRQSNTRRQTVSLSPSWTNDLSDRFQLRLGGNYTDVSYETSSTGLLDYEYTQVDASLAYALSEKDNLSGNAYVNRFEVPDSDGKTDTLGLQVAWSHAFDETIRGSAGLGTSVSRLQFAQFGQSQDKSSLGLLADITLEKDQVNTQWRGQLTRSLSPTGNGFVVRRDELRLSINHKLRAWMSAFGSIALFRNASLEDTASDLDRKYGRLEVAFQWRFRRAWAVIGQYQYIRQKYDEASSDAQSNLLMLTLAYDGTKRAISR